MKNRMPNKLTLLFLFLLATATHSYAQDKNLVMPWPKGWQATDTVIQKNALHRNARLQADGHTLIDLKITAIDTTHAEKKPDTETAKLLTTQLRDAIAPSTKEKDIPLQSFPDGKGFYFLATDHNPKPEEFDQMIEGIALDRAYIINFTLLSDDMTTDAAKQIIQALGQIQIQ